MNDWCYAYSRVLIQAIPNLKEELCEFLFCDRRAVDAYPLSYRNEMWRRVQSWIQNLRIYDTWPSYTIFSPTFQLGLACRINESVNAQVDPFPFVPVTCTTFNLFNSNV